MDYESVRSHEGLVIDVHLERHKKGTGQKLQLHSVSALEDGLY